MGQPWRAQLVGDPEDSFVVGAARGATRRTDQLRVARDCGERPKGRRDTLPVEGDNVVVGRRTLASLLEERGSLPPPDPRHIVPSLVAPRRPDGTLRGDKVKRA